MKQYRPDGNVLSDFAKSDVPVKIVQGPIGSGKSLVCAMLLWHKALKQKVQSDGVRRMRAHVFRDVYAKLEDTTLKTWLEWFPEDEFGHFFRSKPYRHEIRLPGLEFDVHFVALEDASKADYFKSLETTVVWFNEVQFIDRVLFDEATTRVGRYPRVIDGGAVEPQVIADMNAPDETHWVPIMRGDVACPDWFTDDQRRAHQKPAGWEFFVQPPGLLEDKDSEGNVVGYKPNPLAENTAFLPKQYYENAILGKTKEWIDANVLNRVSPRRGGKPVFKDFNRSVHVAKKPFDAIQGLDLLVGCDFGRDPCAIVMQSLRGSWYVIAELISHDMGASRFAPLLRNMLAQRFNGHRFKLWGDPSGDFKGQNDDQTPFQIFRRCGLPIQPAPSILFTIRLQAAEAVLTRMHEGKPSLLLSPSCSTLLAALDGGYHYRRLKVQGERYTDEPEKDQYSHPCFVAGTMVTTAQGRKPIEAIVVGEAVLTPLGYRRVTATMHRPVSELCEVALSDGRKILCTPNHPFALGSGFVRADALVYGDTLHGEEQWEGQLNTQSKTSKAFAIIESHLDTTRRTINSAVGICTGRYGSTISAQFQRAMTFITKTAIGVITPFPIWSVCQSHSTQESTWLSLAELKFPETVSARPERPQSNGTPAQKAGNGIGSMRSASRRASLWKHIIAPIAARNTKSSSARVGVASVLAHASRPRVWRLAWMTNLVAALSAAVRSWRTATRKNVPAPVVASTRCYRASEPSEVYDLTVEDAHVFFAEGVLVHNCDAFMYGLLGGGEGRALLTGSTAPGKPVQTRRPHNPFFKSNTLARW